MTYDNEHIYDGLRLLILMCEPGGENAHHNDGGDPDYDVGGKEERREAGSRTSR